MSGAKDALKLMIGRAAEIAFPALGGEADRGRAPRLTRAVLYARLRRAHASGDAGAMEAALAAFWKGEPGDQFHNSFAEERLQVFKARHAEAVDALAGLIGEGAYNRLVEIGCGDGGVLVESLKRLPSIRTAVGIDINAGVIAQATIDHGADPRLSFEASEARDWLAAHPQAGTVMMTNGGVLEYVSPQNVEALFAAVGQAEPAAVLLIEPLAPDHDLDRQRESFAFGQEYSFSHNYRHRLRQAGFEVAYEKEAPAFGARLITIIGVRR